MAKNTMPPATKTSPAVRKIAAEGLKRPSSLTAKEVRTLAGEVMEKIEPRKNDK